MPLSTDIQLVQNAENHLFEQYPCSGPWRHMYLHVFLSYCPSMSWKVSSILSLLTPEVKFQIYFYTRLPCCFPFQCPVVPALYIQNVL